MPQSRGHSKPLSHPSQTGEGASDESGGPRGLTFDLFSTVTTFKRLLVLLEPVSVVWEIVKHLLGWKMPFLSLLCCVLLNALFLTLSEGAWFFLGLLSSLALATLGYLKKRSRSKASELALQRERHSGIQREDLQAFHTTQEEVEAVLETKALLTELDEMLSRALLYVEFAHRALCWESRSHSALFHGGLLTVLCLLYTAPGRCTLVVVNSALFLWSGEFSRAVRGRSKPINQNKTSSCSGIVGHSGGDVEGPEEVGDDYDFKDAIEDGDDEDDNEPLMARRGALVGEIPSFRHKGHKPAMRVRKLHLSNSSGNCSHCHASFSVLKRKRTCRSCGSSFCTRCCSSKVHRSCLDLAGPDASSETVFVCTLCSESLSKE